jgi:hypothetical protein
MRTRAMYRNTKLICTSCAIHRHKLQLNINTAKHAKYFAKQLMLICD